jgi:hypothetical protein
MLKVRVIAISIILVLGSIFDIQAQDRPISEVHSMLVFNFLKYIEWPADAKSGDFEIAVIGDDEVFEALSKFYSNRKLGAQSVKISNYSSTSDVDKAHLVYLSAKRSNEFEDLKTKFEGKPTLTITDKNGLGKKGSCINFRVVGGKLRFEVNEQAFADSNLKISSQLISMGIAI